MILLNTSLPGIRDTISVSHGKFAGGENSQGEIRRFLY
jgi:hypothetical protein